MRRKIGMLVLSALLMVICLPFLGTEAEAATVGYGTCGENLTWLLEDDGKLSIMGIGAMDSYLDGGQPWENCCEEILSLEISEGVTSIGCYAFSQCSNLTKVDLPESLTVIDGGAFWRCESLKSVKIPSKVTAIEYDTFDACTSLQEVVLPDGIVSIGGYAFGSCSSLQSIDLPDSLITIDAAAFYDCDGLINIELPEGVTGIPGAFQMCDGLTAVNIPASVESMHEAFMWCDNLIGIWVDEDNAYYSSDSKGVLYNKDKTELVQIPAKFSGAYYMPNSVESIYYNASSYCTGLTYIEFSNSLKNIEREAFYGCTGLKKAILPDSVVSIGDYAFCDCESLERVVLSANLESVGMWAFGNCALTQIVIPESVTAVDYGALAIDGSSMWFIGDPPTAGFMSAWAFEGSTVTAYYPADNTAWTDEVRDSYKGSVTWIAYNKYDILDGADAVLPGNYSEAHSVRASGKMEKFVAVYLDGELVASENYTVTEGSTIVTFAPEFLASLSNGVYEVTIEFEDGAAFTTLTIQKMSTQEPVEPEQPTKQPVVSDQETQESTEAEAGNPKTADAVVLPLFLLMVLSTAGLAALIIYGKCNYKNI